MFPSTTISSLLMLFSKLKGTAKHYEELLESSSDTEQCAKVRTAFFCCQAEKSTCAWQGKQWESPLSKARILWPTWGAGGKVARKPRQQEKLLSSSQIPELQAELLFISGTLLHHHVHVTPWQKTGQANPHLPAKDPAVKKAVSQLDLQGPCQIHAVYYHVSPFVSTAALSLLRDTSLLPQGETFTSWFQQHVSDLQRCKQVQSPVLLCQQHIVGVQ